MEILYKVSSQGVLGIIQWKHYKSRLKICKHMEIKYHPKIAKYLEMEILYKVSSQGVGHNSMRTLQKSPKDLQAYGD